VNLLYVTPFLRVPPDFGIAIRNYHMLEHLTAWHEVTVVTYGKDETGTTDPWLTERGARVVRLDYALPWGNHKGRRSTLQNLAYYPPASFQRFSARVLHQALQDAARTMTSPDVTILDTALTGQAVLAGPLPGQQVLVLPDMYQTLLWREFKRIGWRLFKVVSFINWFKTRQYENRILSHHSHLIAVSSVDFDFLQKHFPRANVALIPNGVDTRQFVPRDADSTDETLLFVGGFEYAPNADAFFYFCRDILPRVRAARPNIKFVVVGRNPTPEMRAYALERAEIELVGTVSDTRPYYARASLVVIPLRAGSGVKLKTLEAFAMGVPVVSTSVGAEGISARDQEHLMICDTPDEFAKHILDLLNDRATAQAMARRARALVEGEYDWQRLTQQMEDFLENLN
jgi:glycosyltransferase involved in cell wall biosynthesis